ncbi:hypothetical protein GALL_314330 [mine drainage metagenome]|uniref:Uncharacterized protein n=1 Tax=mine drainage metagenome TaxID=410659 RepID=A0A1J5RF18_9ZZZZ
MLIDLDVIRPDFGPHAQAGKAFAQVIHGNFEAHGAVVPGGFAQHGVFQRGGVLGQFDDDLVGPKAGFGDAAQGFAAAPAFHQQRIRADVEEYLARELELGAGLQHDGAAQVFNFQRSAMLSSGLEQHQRRMQRAVGGSADQPLIAKDRGIAHLHDGLEYCAQASFADDFIETLPLLGCLLICVGGLLRDGKLDHDGSAGN